MAGRTQQYLRTEYIQPPPGPPTDAKNSPLALLAQTCSAIGKESPSSGGTKLTSGQSKIFSGQQTPDPKRSPTNVTLHKPPQSNSSRSPPLGQSSPRRGSPVSPTLSASGGRGGFPAVKREKSPQSSGSPAKKMRSSPELKPSSAAEARLEVKHQQHREAKRSEAKHRPSESKRRHTSSVDESSKHSHPASDSFRQQKSPPALSPISSKPYCSSHSSSGSNCGCPLTTSSVCDSARHTSPSSTSPHQQQQHSNPMLSLYDPFCVGCQGPHVAGSSCFESLKSTHGLPFYPFANPASTYYAQMVMAAAARSGGLDPVPHICNWVNVGSGSCGKRFSTAEELSNHLRTHAVPSVSGAASGVGNFLLNGLDKLSTNPYAAYLSQQAAALAAVSPPANSTGSGFLARSTSPLGRYHPYKASSMLGQLSGVPSIPIAAAGAGPYCSPFAFYGQRLGAAASGFSYP